MSTRIAAAQFPPEPEGRAIAVDGTGMAWQRDPQSVMPTGPGAAWHPIAPDHSFRPGSRTWRQLHADGPVAVVWDPAGRDRAHAAALAAYGKAVIS